MKKLFFILFVSVIAISCKKKGNYTCSCMGPYGAVVGIYPYSGEYKAAISDCANWQNKWGANKAYVGTQCNLK